MTMQVRSESGDRRWFNPERDMVWAFPRIISKALHYRFNSQEPLGGLTSEQVGEQCSALGKLCRECAQRTIKPEEVKERLDRLDPLFLAEVGTAFFRTFFTEFRFWCAQVAPRTEQDEPLTLDKLEEEIDKFAR